MQNESGIAQSLRALPLVHKVVMGVAVAALAMGGFALVRWVSEPSYTLLYGGLDDTSLGEVVDQLETTGTTYKIEAGGTRVLVPKQEVHRVRATLAAAGVRSGSEPVGFEILDDQGLNVSDFRQRVDYQRALEGELARTLMAMEGITTATVHLVIPDDALFQEDEEPVTASVLVDGPRTPNEFEVETIAYLVSSSVEGLEPSSVTVADVSGEVLQAAGEMAGATGMSNRNLRMTRDFEAALATDVERLLTSAVGPGLATVVVRAELDFDELATESETYDPDSTVVIRSSSVGETFNGSGTPPGGTVGVDGAPEPTDLDEYVYERSENTSESGVDRTVTRTVRAPGRVNSLSVAVVMDDGSQTGVTVPPTASVEALLVAALGMDPSRGDTVAVTSVPFPARATTTEPEAVAAAAEASPMTDIIPQAAGGAALVFITLALLWMMRRGRRKSRETEIQIAPATALPSGSDGPAAVEAGSPIAVATTSTTQSDVLGLIERQPEEIAVLLRSWLADRR